MNELKLTIQEAQELLLLSQSSVYSWIDKGKLQSMDTPGGKIIVISRKDAEEIRNLNLKSRRNKVGKQVLQRNSDDEAIQENSVINAEILENEDNLESPKASDDVTLRLVARIEELAVNAGRYKQLEILRNEEKENVKFWQHKFLEANAELKKKEFEIQALKVQISELQKAAKSPKKAFLDIFKKH